jgi:hypothetical protein
MTTTAQSIIQRAQDVLQDTAGTRWPATELVRHLNDGQRELVRLRPDTTANIYPVTLAGGFYQSLPDQYMVLMDVMCNTTGKKRRITKTDIVQLDAVSPDWRSRTQATEVVHFMHDMRDPRAFHVYPPVQSGTQVDLLACEYPTDIPNPSGAAFSSVTGNIDLPDKWAEPLLNFVLFKAYSKDAEYGGNAQIAAGYLGLFNAAIGSQLQSSTAVAPQT